jgi:hypothetical protein
MNNDTKFDEAQELIDAFAAKLLALNGGKAIPRTWKNYLLKALKPAPQRRGKEADYQKIAAISKELTLNRNRLAAPDRTRKDKRGETKKAIAGKHKISTRTVERYAETLRQPFKSSANGKPPDEKKMRALIDGRVAALSNIRTAEQRAERVAEYKASLRKFGIREFSDWVQWAPNNFEPHKAIYFDDRRVETKKDLRKLIAEMKKARKSGR